MLTDKQSAVKQMPLPSSPSTFCVTFKDPRLVVLRPELLAICDYDDDAAIILNQFIVWTSGKLRKKQPTWIYKSQEELADDLLGSRTVKTVRQAVKRLIDLGFLEKRTNQANTWDRTGQYQLKCDVVQAAIDALHVSVEKRQRFVRITPLGKFTECIRRICRFHSVKVPLPFGKNDPLDSAESAHSNYTEGYTEGSYKGLAEGFAAAARATIFRLYENAFGLIPPILIDELAEAADKYQPDWLEDAFVEAARSGGKNWKYVSRILERWAREGRGIKTPPPSSAAPPSPPALDDAIVQPVIERVPVLQVVNDDNPYVAYGGTYGPMPVLFYAWLGTVEQLRVQLDPTTFSRVIRGTAYAGDADGVVTLRAENEHAALVLIDRLAFVIARMMSIFAGYQVKVKVVAPEDIRDVA